MKPSDYIDMFDEASSTGRDSVRVLDMKGEVQTKQETIDVKAKDVTSKQPKIRLITINDPDWYRKPKTIAISEDISEYRKSRVESKFPNSINTQLKADFYVGIVGFTVNSILNQEKYNSLVYEVGGSDHDINMFRCCNQKETFLSWVSKKLNISIYTAALVIGDSIGIKPENCFSRFGIANKDDLNKDYSGKEIFAIPNVLDGNGIVFTRLGTDFIYNYKGDKTQLAIKYTSSRGDIFAFASKEVGNGYGEFKIGFSVPIATLPSQEMISSHCSNIILLCLDKDVTMKMREMARESRLIEHTGVIVSGLYGGKDEIEALDWSPVTFHKVVIVASPGLVHRLLID